MIHFFISAQSEVGGRSLEHTLFEVGVRLGSPFIIHKNRSHIPCDASVVSIGKLGQAALGWRLLELPDALDSGCEQVCADGLDLWARREDEGIDVISGCAELIGFRHEKSVAPRDFDAFGRIPSSKHPLVQAGVATRPLIENNVKYIENRLAEIGHRYERIYPWGKSGKYVACLSHDVDGPQLHTLFALSRSLIYALRGDRYERESLELGVITQLLRRPDPYWNFEHWLRLERFLGISSTYFFYPGCGPEVKRHPRDPRYSIHTPLFTETLKRISDSGNEIGIHNPIQGHHREGYREAMDRLGDMTGAIVRGCRAHYWAIDWKNPYSSWRTMSEAGLLYDSSLNPLSLGYRGGSMSPITPSVRWGEFDSPFVVLPTSIMDAHTIPRNRTLSPEQIRENVDSLYVMRNRSVGCLCSIGIFVPSQM